MFIRRWYIYLIYMFSHYNMLYSEGTQSLPHLPVTLCSNFLPLPTPESPPFPSPTLVDGVGHFLWTLICKCIKGHGRAVQAQGSIQPVKDNFGNSKCFFFCPSCTHALLLLRNPVRSCNKPRIMTYLEDSDKAHLQALPPALAHFTSHSHSLMLRAT